MKTTNTNRLTKEIKRHAITLQGAFALAALMGLGVTGAHAQVLWSTSGGSAWLTGSNWTGSAVPTAAQIAQFGVNPTAATGVGINFNGTTNSGIQINGQKIQDVGAIEVTSARAAAFLVGNNSTSSGATGIVRFLGVSVNSVPGTVLRNNSNQAFTLQNVQGSGSQTTAYVLGNAASNVVNVDSTGNIVISSAVSGAGATSKLVLNAASSGDLRLSGAGTWTGGTDVAGGAAGGRLRIDAVAALPTTGTVAVSTGGRITLNLAGTYGGAAQALTFNPNQTTNPSLDILSGAAVTWQGTVALNADTRVEANGGAGTLTFSGNVSGSSTLIKQAAGNLVFSGTGNTATGGTQIGNGTVTVNSGSGLGTGSLTLFQTSTNNTALTLNNATQSIGNLSSSFTAVTGTQTQVVTLTGTALTVNQSSDTTYGVGAVSNLTSTIAGTGSLVKSGAAGLTLTGANSYTGATTVSNGTLALQAGSPGALNTTSAVNVNAGTLLLGASNQVNNTAKLTLNSGTFNTGGFSETLGALILSATSPLDLGAANASVVNFATSNLETWSPTAFLDVLNYSGVVSDFGTPVGTPGDALFFGSGSSDLTLSQIAAIRFVNPSGYIGSYGATLDANGQVLVAVPEPATIFGALGLLGLVGYRERRRFFPLAQN